MALVKITCNKCGQVLGEVIDSAKIYCRDCKSWSGLTMRNKQTSTTKKESN